MGNKHVKDMKPVEVLQDYEKYFKSPENMARWYGVDDWWLIRKINLGRRIRDGKKII